MSSPPPAPVLERHQRRREQGVPTLTVLVGPPAAALSLWRHWLDTRGRALAVSQDPTPEGMLREWVEALASPRALVHAAAHHLGAAAGLTREELPRRLGNGTAHEREVLLRPLLATLPPGDVPDTCRSLLQLAAPDPTPAETLGAVLAACEGDAARALGAVHALVPEGVAPALLLSDPGTAGWLDRAAPGCARACEARPSLGVALQTGRDALETWLRGAESGARALVREGRVDVAGAPPEELKRRLEALGVERAGMLAGPLEQLAADGVPDEVLARYGEAAREREAVERGGGAADQAHSEAERFLHGFLDALPATRGLFELNARAEFRLRGRAVEVDFLSRRLRLAIEVDGYHHFREPERYRRDRRKDLALQRHGYWVLRFLAEDVVVRLEEIRDTLLEVVSIRRRDLGGSAPHGEDGDEGR